MTTTNDKLKEIKDKLKGETKPVSSPIRETEKSEKTKEKKKNGGRRPGSGRKPIDKDEKRVSIKKSWESFAEEEIEVQELHKGTREVRKIKMARLRVAQEKLFKGVQNGDIAAIREFNDRVGGKARQPLVGDEDESPIQVDIGVDRMLDKVYGTEEDEG